MTFLNLFKRKSYSSISISSATARGSATGSATELGQLLKRSIRRGRVLTAPAQLAGYDSDGLGYKNFRPDAVVIPEDCDELVQLLRGSAALNVPITMRGAGTSLSGGPVAAQGGIVVHTSSLKSIRTICREGLWCEVECSVVLNQLDAFLEPYGLFYPPDPSSGPVCTLGGNVAMNAGGAHCFRYGVTSNYVLGVEAVLLDGSVHRFGGPAGGRGDWSEDWKRLMVGSEGTLAAFTRFWLRLVPRPEKAWTYRAMFAELRSAERAIQALAAHASFPVAIELMDPRCVAMVEQSPMAVGLPRDQFLLVTEIDGPAVLVDARAAAIAELLRDAGALSVEFSDDEVQRKRLWKARKVAGGLMGQLSPDFMVQDAVIPKSALADVLQLVYELADAAGLPVVNVFHAGDGNLHPNFLFDSHTPGELEKVEAISKRFMQRVVAVGGTLSGEHGIGNDKTAYMPLVFDEATLRLQLAIPKVFNPRHQLNPLKVFAGRRFENGAGKNPTIHLEGATDAGLEGATASERSSRVDNPAICLRGLFEPFFDSVDGVLCVPASTTATELRELCQPCGLRFPLMLDDHCSLGDQVAASPWASASSRFGPYCDNILGMNWQLPGGRVVRIGERVVKSTTGYDLQRFLLHSRDRFGRPLDFVLRLRPDCGTTVIVRLAGKHASVARTVADLQTTCWLHWLDAVDVIYTGDAPECDLRLQVNCPDPELPLYEDYLHRLATTHSLSHKSVRRSVAGDAAPLDGCPDFVMKTTPDRSLSLAAEIASKHGIQCIALCTNGVVHGWMHTNVEPLSRDGRELALGAVDVNETVRMDAILADYSASLCASGGECLSRHIAPRPPEPLEAAWLDLLNREFAL